MLERISTDSFARESDDFTRGFRYAEQQIMTLDALDMLELAPERSLTQGQILRAMVKQARSV